MFVIVVIVFMFGVTSLIAYLLTTTVINTSIFDDTPAANYSIQSTKNTILSFDNMMMFVIVGLSVFVICSAAVVFNHPAFFIAATFLLFIAVVVAAIASNAFWDFTNSATIASTASAFPKIIFLMNNLPLYVAFVGALSSIAAFTSYMKQGQ